MVSKRLLIVFFICLVHTLKGQINSTLFATDANGKLMAFDAKDGRINWSVDMGNGSLLALTVYDGMLYVGTYNDALLRAYDVKTGALKWTYYLGMENILSSPTVVNGIVYIGGWDYKVHAINAKTGVPIWKFSTRNLIQSSPTVANNTVFIGANDNTFYALSADSGLLKWKVTLGQTVPSSPTVYKGIVYVGSNRVVGTGTTIGVLYALQADSGQVKWSFSTTSRGVITTSPVVYDNVAYMSASDGQLYAIDAMTGEKKWSFVTGATDNVNGSGVSPVVDNGHVYVGTKTPKLYALDVASGAKIWEYTANGNINSEPVLANNVLFFSSTDGKFVALDATNGSLLWAVKFASNFSGSHPCVIAQDGKIYHAPRSGTENYFIETHDIIQSGKLYSGKPVSLSYTATSELEKAGNDFVIQLSDSTGTAYTTLPTSRTGAIVNTVLPENLVPGRRYAIRVVSTYHPVVGTNAPSGVLISERPRLSLTTVDSVCSTNRFSLTATAANFTPTTYTWNSQPSGMSAHGNIASFTLLLASLSPILSA